MSIRFTLVPYAAGVRPGGDREKRKMRAKTLHLTMLLLMATVTAAVAQAPDIPRYTVVPVVLEDALSSTASAVGDRFYMHCATDDCGGFPMGTRFVGVVTAVTKKSGNTPGQLEVRFTQAVLPTGQTLSIDGTLTSLNENAVTADPQTGRLSGTVESRDQRNKFIGYGAGAGLLIGALTGNFLKGGLLGAAAGWLAGATIGTSKQARDVYVPEGTQFGILLQNAVNMPSSASPPPPGAGPAAPTGTVDVTFTGSARPFMEQGGAFMVPLRTVMDQLRMPFKYDSSKRTVTVYTSSGEVTNTVGSSVAYVNGNREVLPGPSRIVNGTLFVPSSMIAVITGKPVQWVPGTRVLRVG